jgi:hypothetical protein
MIEKYKFNFTTEQLLPFSTLIESNSPTPLPIFIYSHPAPPSLMAASNRKGFTLLLEYPYFEDLFNLFADGERHF